ncbi:MAG TPA: FAD-dependent oxidoreductase [Rubrobacter sp.]|nr:FAD-dependent oxidoreductase [Rubrobacter sp.]
MRDGAEVLVVGASLAGLCAAYSAAREGAETLLIDAAPEVGARPNPATILMEPLWRRSGLPIPAEAVERELSGLRVSGPSGRGPLLRLRAVQLDRRRFDRYFAARAAEAGAIVSSGVRVDGLLSSGGVRTESGTVPARVTIFADGATSAVREAMPTMRNPEDVALGLDQLLGADDLGVSSYFEVRFGSFAPGWRAQLNPLGGEHARLWTFIRGVPREELESCAAQAQRTFCGAAQIRVLEERRGVDPAFVVPGRIAGDGVMACGAAAGQGGLEYGARAGLLAGRIAARAVRCGDTSRHALITYERVSKRETRAELAAIRWGMASLQRLSDTELDALFSALQGLTLEGEDLEALLRGDLVAVVRKTGAAPSARVLLRLFEGWMRALWRG